MDKKYCSKDSHDTANRCASSISKMTYRTINNSGTLDAVSIEASCRLYDLSTEQINNKFECNVEKMNILTHRLRRCLPKNRIAYAGMLNPYSKEDWILYKSIYEEDCDYYNSIFSDRWLLSILDTYIDYGDVIESKNAMIASLFIRYERISGTEAYSCRHYIDNRTDFDEKKIKRNSRVEIWPSILTTHMPVDDYYINLFSRHMYCLRETPNIKNLFVRFVKNAMSSDKSLISVICKTSPWVKEKIITILELTNET